jgi:hypothetical protein
MMADWMRRAERSNQADDPPIWSDDVADQYSITEREQYYDELIERDAKKYSETNDSEEENPAAELNDMPGGREEALDKAREFLRSRTSTTTMITPDGVVRDGEKGCGFEIFDLKAIDADPDERLTELNGNQELLDPLDTDTLTDAQFDALDTTDSAAFLRRLDPNVAVADWLPPSLEQLIASLRTGKVSKTLNEWKIAFVGPVRRFIDSPRQTQTRTQFVYFVRKDLYLLLLLDRAAGDSFVIGASFWAWGFQRANLLIQESLSKRKK